MSVPGDCGVYMMRWARTYKSFSRKSGLSPLMRQLQAAVSMRALNILCTAKVGNHKHGDPMASTVLGDLHNPLKVRAGCHAILLLMPTHETVRTL